jgi:lysine 6-dehydrogenase
MGQAAVYDLTRNEKIEKIIAADIDISAAEKLKARFKDERIIPMQVDVARIDELKSRLDGTTAILGAVHYKFNYELSRMAIELGAHFCDLGGNNSIVDQQMTLSDEAAKAGVSIIPDCGLAPGIVSVVVAHGEKRFDRIDDIHLRVGGLPQDPRPPLDYMLVFSVEGLINEYVEPVRVIRDGEVIKLSPLSEIEDLSFPEPFDRLEAFTTSGGTSTLVGTYLGRVRNLDYKTIRYLGHCDKIRAFLDLGFFSSDEIEISGRRVVPREMTGKLLERSLPSSGKDVVLVQVELIGEIDGRRRSLKYRLVDSFDDNTGLTAMMRMTAFPAIIVSQMQADGRITARGTVPQEIAVPPEQFFDELAKWNIVFDEIWTDV